MNEKKPEQKTDKDNEPVTGQGTSPAEQGLFECHPENGENCDGHPAPEKPLDPSHPPIKKVEAVQNPERPKDERALFGCDANGKNCDS